MISRIRGKLESLLEVPTIWEVLLLKSWGGGGGNGDTMTQEGRGALPYIRYTGASAGWAAVLLCQIEISLLV